MNSSGIVTIGPETYILAVYTMDDKTYGEGFRSSATFVASSAPAWSVRPRAHPELVGGPYRARPKLARELASA